MWLPFLPKSGTATPKVTGLHFTSSFFKCRVSLHFLCCYWFFSVNVYNHGFSVTLSHLCAIPAVFTPSVLSLPLSLVPSVVLVAFETVSLCSLSWSQTHNIAHPGLTSSRLLGFQECPTMPNSKNFFLKEYSSS